MERQDKYDKLRKLSHAEVRVIADNRKGWLFGYSWSGDHADEYKFCVRFTPYGTMTISVNNHIQTLIDGQYVTVDRAYFTADELEFVE